MAARGEHVGICARAEKADQARRDDDEREGRVEHEQRYERGRSDCVHRPVLQRPLAHTHQRIGDDRQNSSLEAEEERRNPGRLLEEGVGRRERDNDDEAGSTKRRPAAAPPRQPCSNQPTYVASCCASGPGSSMQ